MAAQLLLQKRAAVCTALHEQSMSRAAFQRGHSREELFARRVERVQRVELFQVEEQLVCCKTPRAAVVCCVTDEVLERLL